MPQMGFEPTIPVSERPKTVSALDCVAAVIGEVELWRQNNATNIEAIFHACPRTFKMHGVTECYLIMYGGGHAETPQA
jgi:hypothetical protein